MFERGIDREEQQKRQGRRAKRAIAITDAPECGKRRKTQGEKKAKARHHWRRSVQFGAPFPSRARLKEQRAGSGNRTRLASLEGWSFTTKLYPRDFAETPGRPSRAWAALTSMNCGA